MEEGYRKRRIDEFLKLEVPDWEDEEVMQARFGSVDRTDPWFVSRSNFWSSLIIRVSQRLKTIVISAEEVKLEWFRKGGLLPMDMDDVLEGMLKNGELQKLETFLPSEYSKTAWSSFSMAFSWTIRTMMGTAQSTSGMFVVTPVLKERAEAVAGSVLHEAAFSSDLLITSQKFQDLCEGEQAAALIMRWLTMERRAVHMSFKGTEYFEGLKLLKENKKKHAVTDIDRQMLRLRKTAENLHERCNALQRQVVLAKCRCREAILATDNRAAVKFLRQKRNLDATIEKCNSFENRIDEVLQLISEAEMTKEVTEALQIGTKAILDWGLSVEDVKACMEEIEEVATQHKELKTALEIDLHGEGGDDEFEEELAILLSSNSEVLAPPVSEAARETSMGINSSTGIVNGPSEVCHIPASLSVSDRAELAELEELVTLASGLKLNETLSQSSETRTIRKIPEAV